MEFEPYKCYLENDDALFIFYSRKLKKTHCIWTMNHPTIQHFDRLDFSLFRALQPYHIVTIKIVLYNRLFSFFLQRLMAKNPMHSTYNWSMIIYCKKKPNVDLFSWRCFLKWFTFEHLYRQMLYLHRCYTGFLSYYD